MAGDGPAARPAIGVAADGVWHSFGVVGIWIGRSAMPFRPSAAGPDLPWQFMSASVRVQIV